MTAQLDVADRPSTARAVPIADAGFTPRQKTVWQRMWLERATYLFIIPGLLFFVVFKYVPLLGNIVAFIDYSPYLGIIKSEWVGLQYFVQVFTDPEILRATTNTLIINGLQLIFFFPAPIALALLLNSIMSSAVKRTIQSIVYLPHFIGWVVLVSVWVGVFGGDGLVNHLLAEWGMNPVNITANPAIFKPMMVVQTIWKSTGWGTIIYLAALTNIDPGLYESAAVDGAKAWRRLWHITLPGIRGITILLLILNLGSLLTTGFEQILLQQPAVGADAAQVLDTYVYFQGVVGGQWGLATAVGLLKGVIGTILIVATNKIAHMFGEDGVF